MKTLKLISAIVIMQFLLGCAHHHHHKTVRKPVVVKPSVKVVTVKKPARRHCWKHRGVRYCR